MYNGNQQRLIAKELARSDRSIPGALDALHRNYEGFRTLSETTLRKLLKEEMFQALLVDEENNLAFANTDSSYLLESAHELTESVSQHPLNKLLATVIEEVREWAKNNPDHRSYEVLFRYLKLVRSLEPRLVIKPRTEKRNYRSAVSG